MTNEAIEAAARAIEPILRAIAASGKVEPIDRHNLQFAIRAAAPALMEEGARLALEAAAELTGADCGCELCQVRTEYISRVRALDPAAIVKGASHDRD